MTSTLTKKEDQSYFEDQTLIKELSPKDLSETEPFKLKNQELCIVMFYAPWCGYCKRSREPYIEFAKKCSSVGRKVGFINVFAFNCEKNLEITNKIKELSPGIIAGYPSVVYYYKGEPVEHFEGDRTLSALISQSTKVCSRLLTKCK